ncbi:MAG: N-acetyl-L-ornithine deacetylase ArgE [Nitrosopumilales archaeon]|nr:MAG: N-acetyl-L-ornithine deacetylase ArgE [Nitrosopumilales archaeon]
MGYSEYNKYLTKTSLLLHDLDSKARTFHFQILQLGLIKNYPLLLFTPIKKTTLPNILIAGGFHGDEPAGPLGILYFLLNIYPVIFETCNISFLPLVNPTGYQNNLRNNFQDDDVNRGFCHREVLNQPLSIEGKILTEYEELILKISQNGFLSLHEDIDSREYYFYTFEKTGKNGIFQESLRNCFKSFFKPCLQSHIYDCPVIDSGILNFHDSSFEDYLFHRGVPFTVCAEAPRLYELEDRILACSAIIESFCAFICGQYQK